MARITDKSKVAATALLLSSDDGFIERMKSVANSAGVESVALPLAGLSPSELRKNRHAAVVDCRSIGGMAQSVIEKLREAHKTMPILAVIESDSYGFGDKIFGCGATLCVPYSMESSGMEHMVKALLRMKESQEKIARLEDMLARKRKEARELVKERDELKQGLAKRVQEQITVYRASRAMFSVFDFDQLANEIVRLASKEIGAEVGSLMIIEGEELVVRAISGHVPGEDQILGRKQKVGEGISGWVAREGKPLLITDIERHPTFRERGGVRYKTKSFVSSPIIAGGRIRGVINLTNKKGGGHFSEDDLRLLRILAMTAAAALGNFELIDKIKRAQAMSSIGQMATRMAHEIRNPLHAIKMTIQILGKKFQLNEDDKEYYDILIGEIERLEMLVRDVLTFARDEQLKIGKSDVNKMLDRILAVLKNQFDEKGVQVHTNLADNLPLAHIDEGKIEQALINLLVNASEAVESGGNIKVSTRLITPFVVPLSHYGEEIKEPQPANPEFIRITVSDDGPGVEEHFADRIFNPFFTTKVNGTGLGLSTSRKIVEMHGGVLKYEREQGEGATFRLSLPVKE